MNSDEINSVAISFFRAFYFIRKCSVRRTIELSGSNFRIKIDLFTSNYDFPGLNARGPSKFAPSVFFEYGVRLRSR